MNQAYNKDIMEILSVPEYDIIYTDPPWENKMVNFFQTQNKKDTGRIVNHSIEEIITKLAKIANTNKPIFIEYSVKGYELVVKIMQENGHKLSQIAITTQTNNKPFVILSFNTSLNIPVNLRGFDNVKFVVENLKPKIVLDLFAGIGQTCKAVKSAGASYIGYELNTKRYEKLLKQL